jgi:hypothetical protein
MSKATVITYNGKTYQGIESFQDMDQAFAFCKNVCTLVPVGIDRFEITHDDNPLKCAVGRRIAREEIEWTVV